MKENHLLALNAMNLTDQEKLEIAHYFLGQVTQATCNDQEWLSEYDSIMPKCKVLRPKNVNKLKNTIKGFFKTKNEGISNKTVERFIEKMSGDAVITINAKGEITWS